MKEKYEILHNAILDSQAYICAIWLEVEGILFILYDNESLKLLKKDDKYYLAEEDEPEETLINTNIQQEDFDNYRDYIQSIELNFSNSDDNFNGEFISDDYKKLEYYKGLISEEIIPYILNLIPGLKKAKDDFDVEVKKEQRKHCIWKTNSIGMISTNEYFLYIFSPEKNIYNLEISSSFEFEGDDYLSDYLTFTNAIGENYIDGIDKIIGREKLIESIGNLIFKNKDSILNTDLKEKDALEIANNINKLKWGLDISANEILTAFKQNTIVP